jgi:predicted O-methyltransferase YrrM
MKGQRTTLSDDIYQYIIDNYVEEGEIFSELDKEYEKHKVPKISITPEQGKFLFVLARLINARKILEIGTLIGYSALWISQAILDCGRLISIEVSEKHYNIASDFFKKHHLDNSIELKLGKAFDLEPFLITESPFDMIFIDADKEQYPKYFDFSLRLLRKGGVLVFDNTLSKGRILDENETQKGVLAVKELNEIMGKSKKVDSILVPIADGMSIGVKK